MCSHNKVALLFFACVMAALSVHAQNPCDHPAPALLAPADGAAGITSPVTFTWTAVPGALSYEVWVSEDGGAFVQAGDTSNPQLEANVDPDVEIEWYVVTIFADCKNQSAHARFRTAGCGSSKVKIVSPPDGGTMVPSPVQFSWTAAPNATGYRLWIAKGDGDFDVLGDSDDAQFVSRLDPGAYTWFVEAFFDACASTDSDVSTFTIPRLASCSAAAPALIAPANGSQQTTNVHFAWTPVQGAIAYDVFAALDDGDFQFVGDTEGSTSLDSDLGVGHVRWVVVAEFNGCDATESVIGEFDIPFVPGCDHNSPLLIAPADGDRDVPTSVDFIWTPVEGAVSYEVWEKAGTENDLHFLGATTSTRLTATVPASAEVTWTVKTRFASCPTDTAPESTFQTSEGSDACHPPISPELFADGEAMSGEPYIVLWSPGSRTASYEIEESTSPSFANATIVKSTEVIATFSHSVTEATRYYYRVRSVSSCGAGIGPYSAEASVVVLPASTSESDADAVGAYGTRTVVQTLHVAGSTPPVTFTASVDKPWLTVTPSSGTLGPDGIDLVVTAATPDLAVGTSNATITINRVSNASTSGGLRALDGGSVTIPVSVSLVTPVTPNPGNSPIPESLIIPAVGHAEGAGVRFESDIRVANTGSQTMKYLLTFTPTASDGTKVGKQTTIQVESGETVALSDVLRNFFGFAAANDSITGVLEIRPLFPNGVTPSALTFASSRTFAVTANGTFGQFIPAIPFSRFIGKTKDLSKPSSISLQQVAQSAKYRTNLGVVEAAGEPATVDINVFASNGTKIGNTFTLNLKPGEHRQFGNFLDTVRQGLPVDDARIEVSVTSATGRVTAYASVLDNLTNDPMLVLPVNPNDLTASRYILPGIADLNSGASWRSDIRLFNASATAVDATLTYYPQNDPGSAKSVTVNLPNGQVYAIDNALQSRFGITNSGGSVVVTTPAAAKIVATARTYNQTSSGTYGQFIPAVMAGEGVGLGQRALQILQVEESPRFRTNVGIVELTGKPVTVEISAVTPDSKVAVKTQINLAPNQFTQLNGLLRSLSLPATYNARVTLKVIAGTGRITGYASLIDNRTQDPTYVPAQ